ncbi:MAG: hypothetical protein ABJF86_17855 [Tateyamaria sp.]|uniref:hypothetical protein n=1 Tax=Tateyamaria sp. TaxID=1929288 RepID=UPI00328EEA67
MKLSLITVATVAAFTLAACSSGNRNAVTSAARAPISQFATGPIFQGCVQSDRKQANRSRCGCVQSVANQSLSAGEQRRGAAFFKNPHQAQVTRTSDRPADERFWLRWKAFGDQAARVCG